MLCLTPLLCSSNLSDTVHDLLALEELRITGCAQVRHRGCEDSVQGRGLQRAVREGGVACVWQASGGVQRAAWWQLAAWMSTPTTAPKCPSTTATQVTTLRLQSQRLCRLDLCGTRPLPGLDMRVARLA